MLRGRIKSVSRLAMSGWAADLDRPDRAIDILVTVDGCRPIRVTTNPSGKSPAIPNPQGARKRRFRLIFSPPLSTAHDHKIAAAFAETGLVLKDGEASIPAATPQDVNARLFPTKTRLLKSMFVICTARSGSTLLMGRLAAHPNIVVAKHAIHEIRMALYYADVLRVLTRPATDEQALNPAKLAEGGAAVGSNPFYHPLFERAFATTDARDFFFQSIVFDRLKSTFRDVVVDYYRCIAADTSKHHAMFFVEKLNNPIRGQLVLSMFPEAKQIVLVRDMRDVLCSHIRFFKQGSKNPMSPLKLRAKHLIEIACNGGSNVVVVRYEDLVLREQQTLERLFGSIGLDYVPVADTDEESRLFSQHATSKSPAASIGRWKQDLTQAEKEQANTAFKEFLEAFEYA